MQRICTEADCGSPAEGQCYIGKPYCARHYWEHFDNELFAEYDKWIKGEDPPERFVYLFARACDEQKWWEGEESYLSKSRIESRGYSFTKTATGCAFRITRHPGAFEGTYAGKKIVQVWEADLGSRALKLVRTVRWRKGYPDP